MMAVDRPMQNINKATINGDMLRIARETAGLTQQEVADKIGVKKQTVSNYECGEGFPSGNVFLRLCMLYKIDARHVVTGS